MSEWDDFKDMGSSTPTQPSAARGAVQQPYLQLDWPDADGDYVILLRGVPNTSVVAHGTTPEQALFRFGDALRLTFETTPDRGAIPQESAENTESTADEFRRVGLGHIIDGLAALGVVETPLIAAIERIVHECIHHGGFGHGNYPGFCSNCTDRLRAVAASPAVPAPQPEITISEIRDGEENEGPLQSTDLHLVTRDCSLLVNVTVAGCVTFAFNGGEGNRRRGTLRASVPAQPDVQALIANLKGLVQSWRIDADNDEKFGQGELGRESAATTRELANELEDALTASLGSRQE